MGNRLYVGNLSFEADRDSVRSAFESVGEVTDVHVVTDRETGRSRGFAFVTMATDELAQEAIKRMDGNVVGGRPLRVNEATERGERGGGGGRGGFGGGGGRGGFGGGRGGGGGDGGGGGGYGGGGGGYGGGGGGYGGGGGGRGGFGGGGGGRGGFGGGGGGRGGYGGGGGGFGGGGGGGGFGEPPPAGPRDGGRRRPDRDDW